MTRALLPTTLEEAVREMREHPSAVLIAGCTDLMVVDYAEDRVHDAVIDLNGVPELSGITVSAKEISVGATTTFREIREHAEVPRLVPILAEVAGTVGGWQIQNRATLGGNIANASPAGDSLPVLLALGAELSLVGPAGERRIAYERMHTGYRETLLQPDELIARIHIPIPDPDAAQLFRKVGTREAQAISKVVVAFHARIDEGRFEDVRIGAGSVAATPIRLTSAESLANGERPTEQLADRMGREAGRSVQPIDDVRSTAEYRSLVLGRIVRRMCLDIAAAHGSQGMEGERS